MIDINKFDIDKEPVLFNAILQFNKIYQNHPKEVTGFSYYELWEKSGKQLPLNVWKELRQDERVRNWFSEELDLSLELNIQKLAQQAGHNNSTATNQALTSLLSYTKEKKAEESNKFFIYSFIPITSVEEHLENVKIVKTIPKGIGDAISSTKRD